MPVVGPESLSLHMWPCQMQKGPCSPGLLGRVLGCDQISSGAPEQGLGGLQRELTESAVGEAEWFSATLPQLLFGPKKRVSSVRWLH